MKNWRLLTFLLASLLFSGCSYQRYFILGNSTDQTISIIYSLDNPKDEKSIFGSTAEVYQSNREYFPNWEQQLVFQDLNNSEDTIHIKLQPKNTLVFGTISNDTYDENSMTSRGGKRFNLSHMTFQSNGIDYTINKTNFHDFFKEDGGTYKYVIQ